MEAYERGTEWEDFKFRPIREWLPEELKGRVNLYGTISQLLNQRKNRS